MAIIILKSKESFNEIENKLIELNVNYKRLVIYDRNIVVVWPDDKLRNINLDPEGKIVETIVFTKTPYMLVSKEFIEKSTFKFGKVEIGSNDIIIIAGPCAVESRDQIIEIAKEVKKIGAHALRGGAFKPRTSPYTFQGLGEEGLKYLKEASEETDLPVVTEVMDTRDVPLVAKYAHAFQIGARNAQNFPLLKEVGKYKLPVFLKRGFGMTIDELLFSAEYIVLEGNDKIVLVERGIRTFERSTRFTLDICAIPVIKQKSHLPIIVDPSHPAGKREYVEALALAGIAAGADGLLIEVHNEPDKALSDKEQQLTPKQFQELMNKLRRLAEALGRKIP